MPLRGPAGEKSHCVSQLFITMPNASLAMTKVCFDWQCSQASSLLYLALVLIDLVGKARQFSRKPMAELCCSVNVESDIKKATVITPTISKRQMAFTVSFKGIPEDLYLASPLKVSTIIPFTIVWIKPWTQQPLAEIPDLNSSTYS